VAQAQVLDETHALLARLARAEAGLRLVADCADLVDRCTTMLTRARLELAAGHLVETREQILRVESLLLRAEKSRETLRRWGPAIGIYQVVVLGGLLALVLAGPGELGLRSEASAPWSMLLLPYFVWGALGGIVAGLFGLYLHASSRDFDRGYIAFYFLKPIVGLVLGPLVYLFAQAGMMAMQTGGAQVQRHELLYLGAFVVGFGERFSLRLIDRVAAAIFGSTDASAVTGGAATTVGAPATEGGHTAAAPTGAIRVHVVGAGLADVSDTSVVLSRGDEEVALRGPGPDEDAEFLFVGVPHGTYSVLAKKPGWEQVVPVQVEMQPGDEYVTAEVIVVEESRTSAAVAPSGTR
jgi:hypothetical protein